MIVATFVRRRRFTKLSVSPKADHDPLSKKAFFSEILNFAPPIAGKIGTEFGLSAKNH